MAEGRLWCPTRGYFEIGAGGPAKSQAKAPAAETPEPSADASAPASAPAAAGRGGGGKLWAPTRGYFDVGSAGAKSAPAAATKAPKAPAGAKSAAAPAETSAATPAAPAAAKKAPASAKKPTAAARKAPAAKKPEAAAAAKGKPEKDPAKESVTTVPTLTSSRLAETVGAAVYDHADSETTLYKVSALNIAFFVCSAFLLVYLVAVMWQDYDRPWKNIQADWNRELVKDYETQLTDLRAKAAEELRGLAPTLEGIIRSVAPDEAEQVIAAAAGPTITERFRSLLRAAEAQLDARYPDYTTLKSEAELARIAHSLEEKQLRADRAIFMAKKFVYEERKRHALERHGDTPEGRDAVQTIEAELAEKYVKPLEDRAAKVEELLTEADAKQKAFDDYLARTAARDGKSLVDLEKDLEKITFSADQTAKNIDMIETNWQNVVRNLPVLDFMAPSYKIDKVVVDDLHEDLQLLTMPRVDRCKTCHLNIDDPDPRVVNYQSDEWGSVYASHPRLDLFVGSASPHPYLQFGCTVCHFGDGRSTDFVTAAHTPNSPEQREEWEKKYHWHRMHHQDWPMLETRYVTSSCGKCHKEEHRLEGGGNWNRGYKLVQTYGCFACHKIQNFENELKVGPNLGYLANKVDRDFAYKWIRNPRSFRYSTRMPRFFDLTNTGGPVTGDGTSDGTMLVLGEEGEPYEMDFHARNGIEALSLATYLTTTSGRRDDLYRLETDGDPVRGREVFRTSGCLGCHSVKRESMNPELGGTAESLAALLDAARSELAALKAQPSRAALATQAEAELEGLKRWFDSLAVGEKVAEHYRRVMAPLTRLEQAEVDVGASKAAATAIYSRWVHNTRGPDLSSVGSKIRDRNWLADWIINPRKHDPDTIMPRLRIEKDPGGDQKVADLVAYLQSLTDPEFEAREVFAIDTEKERKLLDDLVYDYLRRDIVRSEAKALIEKLSQEEKLTFVGHRLIRRYGCFGCHNGIEDSTFTPDVAGGRLVRASVGTMDKAQRIGTELNGWGSKLQERLDYSVWGHQPSGREAIPQRNRYAWIHAKLTDTRRFDVFPNEQVVDRDKGIYHYATTRRLIQKTPEELLKMPRFAFMDHPHQVEAVIAFIVGLVDEPIQPSMHRRLVGDDRVLEEGARLIAELNCQGCHRIGAENQYVHLDDLPSFSLYDDTDEAFRLNEMEKETWLARPQTLLGNAKEGAKGLHLDFGTLLGKVVYDRTSMSLDNDDDTDDEPISVVELARRNAVARQIPHGSQLLPVAAYQEGGMRFYFGTTAQTRAQAPPPLVREGERVRSDWMFRFFLDVQPIRPWLKVRMPSFHLTQEQSRTLVRWFKTRSGLPTDGEVFEADRLDRAVAETGQKIFGREEGGLQCLQCHPAGESLPTQPILNPEGNFDWRRFGQFGFTVPEDGFYAVWRQGAELAFQDGFDSEEAARQWARQNVPAGAAWAVGQPWSKETWGPDLSMAAVRLRPPWIQKWLQGPPNFMPGTKMPNFFGEPDPMADPAEEPFPTEDSRQKIHALIQYLAHMEEMNELLTRAGSSAGR